MSIRVGSLFTGRWEVFWATTYSFELELFDEYLFRRLGEPPLNATVLVDFTNLAHLLEGIAAGEEWRIQRVNRNYLLRGLAPTFGSFHPKTYFFGNEHEGSLLVGSGNLGLKGIDEGYEVFCRFDSADSSGLAAIASWRRWMARLVDGSDDEELQHRWFRLQRTIGSWIATVDGPSKFVHNLDRTLADQFLDAVRSPVDEMHLTAPFFDRKAQAVAALLAAAKPRRVILYLGADPSVDGTALKSVLAASNADVLVRRYDPLRFVHAKLLGLVTGTKGRLLSGSGNLSIAALQGVASHDTWSNIEAGVIVETDAEVLRSVFGSSGLDLVDAALDELPQLRYREPLPPIGRPVRLRAARCLDDGRISLRLSGELPDRTVLTTGSQVAELEGDTTKEPVPIKGAGALVWLEGSDGVAVSNRVALDDTATLRRQLERRAEGASERPRELDAADLDTPVGRVLLRLHNDYIFDIDETKAMREAERADESDGEVTNGKEFWDQLAREELATDPRASAYRRQRQGPVFEDDDVLRLLRMMLDRTPEERVRLLHEHCGTTEEEGGEGKPGTRWTPTQRLQVRLMNVLRRWTRSLADPRMNWLDPFASVRNFQALTYALGELWELEALPEEKHVDICRELFGSFIRSEKADGYLTSLIENDRAEALKRILDDGRSLAAALVFMGLRSEARWKEYIFDWQVWLLPAIEWGLLFCNVEAAKVAGRVLGTTVTPKALEERIQWAAAYIDDPQWCKKMAEFCGLKGLQFSTERFAYELVLEVSDQRILELPGIVKLVRAALDYRRADGVIIMSGPERLSVRVGETAIARLADKRSIETAEVVTHELLATLDEQGLTWRDVFERELVGDVAS